jgi:hypothetical protein
MREQLGQVPCYVFSTIGAIVLLCLPNNWGNCSTLVFRQLGQLLDFGFPAIGAIVGLWFREKNCGWRQRFTEDKILNFAIIGARFIQMSTTVVFEAFF